MKTRFFSFLVVAPFALSACGGLPSGTDQAAPLATLRGTLSVTDGASPPASVRVALVWRTDPEAEGEASGEHFNVAEDVEVTAQFPARFQLTLRNPPPESALLSADVVSSIAFASVVAYEDRNGNGHLDLVDSNATSFVDGIVGANQETLVVWLPEATTGALADNLRDALGNVPTAGFNLLHFRTKPCQAGGSDPSSGDPPPAGDCDAQGVEEWLPITAPFDLAISDDPEVNQLMCEHIDSGAPSSGADGSPTPGAPASVPEGPFPAADDPGLTCHPDGRGYVLEDCPVRGLCDAESGCAGKLVTLPDGAAPPAGWPCSTP